MLTETSMSTAQSIQTTLHALGETVRGELILPGDQNYDTARQVWNAAYDRRPAAILRPAGAEDVAQAVRIARRSNLPVAIRSGGHSIAGHGTCDGGLVIDLSGLTRLEIDREQRVARAGAGLTGGQYAQQLQPYGLATPTGDVASVGLAGLTLGGGIGFLARKYGLTVDNLLGVEMVTAEGERIRASADEHAELFWGIRGGGGNFGIVTSLEYRLQPAGMVLGGAIFFHGDDAKSVLSRGLRYALGAPDELTTIFALMSAPPAPFIPAHLVGVPVVAILVCYTGDLAEGQQVIAPLRALGTPIADIAAPMPYPALFNLTAAGTVPGHHHHVRAGFFNSMDDDTLDLVLAHVAQKSSPLAMVQIRPLGGAVRRAPAGTTAFSHRDKDFLVAIINSWEGAQNTEQHRPWSERMWAALEPRVAGAFVSFLGDEGPDRLHSAYSPDSFERLVALKRTYDPTNFFAFNANIRPYTGCAEG